MKIKARYSGKCARCGDPIKAGDEVDYDPECKSVMHPSCAIDAEDTEASPVKPVQAGTTARFKAPPMNGVVQGARNQAFEEAALAAEAFCNTSDSEWANMYASDIAELIRKLKS